MDNVFENIKQFREDGTFYWSASQLFKALGYAPEDTVQFKKILNKAMNMLGKEQKKEEHFHLVYPGKMVFSVQKPCYELSKYACFLVAQAAVPETPEVYKAREYFSPFEKYKHLDKENGRLYWKAHEINEVFGYKSYPKFKLVIEKAKALSKDTAHHFHLIQTDKMNKSGRRPIYLLSKYACFLIAQSADPKKPEVQYALEYFNPYSIDRYYISKYVEEANKRYIRKITLLDKYASDFMRDDTYQKRGSRKLSSHHIMYKIYDKVNVPYPYVWRHKSESQYTIGYEFLVEYSTEEPSVGIYYGCKGFIVKDDELGEGREQLCRKLDAEWNYIKGKVCEVLNNTFSDKDFTRRIRVTDNVNNGNYWPFWITLYDDEEIDVAVIALKAIKRVYDRYVFSEKGEELHDNTNMEEKNIETLVAFTQEKYDEILDEISRPLSNHKDYVDKSIIEYFEAFLKGAEIENILKVNPLYEKAWQLQVDNNDFAYLLSCLFEWLSKKVKGFRGTVPWTYMASIFLNKDGMFMGDNLRSSIAKERQKDVDKDRAELLVKKIMGED